MEEGGHPVTGSYVHLCLFDRFHEGNASKPKEILRHITHVPQLLNTQHEEQLNYSINKDTRFINQIKPVNHLFLFRCITDIRNRKINDKIIDNLQNMSKFKVMFDINGRAVIDPLKKHSSASLKGKKRPQKRQPSEISDDPTEEQGNPNKKSRLDNSKPNEESINQTKRKLKKNMMPS